MSLRPSPSRSAARASSQAMPPSSTVMRSKTGGYVPGLGSKTKTPGPRAPGVAGLFGSRWPMISSSSLSLSRLAHQNGKWQMAQDLRSAARLSWIMFHLPCSPLYHDVPESVEGSHSIAACRGDHGRHEPDREMECGNALD